MTDEERIAAARSRFQDAVLEAKLSRTSVQRQRAALSRKLAEVEKLRRDVTSARERLRATRLRS